MAKVKEIVENEKDFDWIQFRNELSSQHHVETTKEKLVRKIKANPLVPVGCLATAFALSYGLWSFRKGDRRMSQMMMRTRIVAQGFTVAALVVGVAMTLTNK